MADYSLHGMYAGLFLHGLLRALGKQWLYTTLRPGQARPPVLAAMAQVAPRSSEPAPAGHDSTAFALFTFTSCQALVPRAAINARVSCWRMRGGEG